MKNKGTTRATVKHHLKGQDYENAILNQTVKYDLNYRIKKKEFKITTVEENKKSLTPLDGKRYICDDGINTLPFHDISFRSYLLEQLEIIESWKKT
jgi:hypothetical protein